MVVGLSFNQPKLCPNSIWNSSGITFADSSTIGASPQSIFVNSNNTVYAANFQNGHIQIWLKGSTSPTGTIITNSNRSHALFVTTAGDVYIDNYANYSIDVCLKNSTSCVFTLNMGIVCYSIFIDTNNSLYCSYRDSHKIIRRSINSSNNQITTVAGAGCPGYQSHLFYFPRGIFVTISFDLYVADTGNHRIQRFQAGQMNATTVTGREAPGTMQLSLPSEVVLDADGYLFITDSGHNRIIGSGPDGFRCVIGCTSGGGSGSNQLSYPQSMAFDSHGNIFVADTNNNRIQKFLLSSNICSK